MNQELIDKAREIGRTGARPTEEERLLFEAWMKGHCWQVCGTWNGTTYVDDDETTSYIDPQASLTRMLWAAWRDRAALPFSNHPEPSEDRKKHFELAHAVWHTLDDSCDDGSDNISIMRSDFNDLCELVPEDHEELNQQFKDVIDSIDAALTVPKETQP